jgi:hypothetical protein
MPRARRTLLLLALAGVGGVLLLIASQRFRQPVLIGPGLLLFAVGMLAVAADAFRSRYVHSRSDESPASVIFEGRAAWLFGVAFAVFGLALASAGLAYTLGAEEELYRFLLRRPGLALLAAGVMLAASGAAGVLGAREWRGSYRRVLASIPQRIGAGMLLAAGLALLAAGAFEVAAPAAFDAALDSLLEPLRSAPR